MPYKNMPEELWSKMDSCVDRVMAQGHDKQSAIGICYTSLMQKEAKPMNGLQKLFANMFPQSVAKEQTEKMNENHDAGGRFASGGGGGGGGDGGGGSDKPKFTHSQRVKITGNVSGKGKRGVIKDIAPSGKYFNVHNSKGEHLGYFHESDLTDAEEKELQTRIKEFSPQYAQTESWDIQTASRIMGDLASLAASEANQQEPDHVAKIGKLIKDIQTFIADEIDEMINGKPEALGVYAKEGKRHSAGDQELIQKAHDHLVEAGAECMRIEKEADGHYRWWLFTTNSYEDTDKEIVSQKALEEDIERMDKEGDYGAVRFWHIGSPDPLTRSAGAGLDIGRCDFVGMIGRVRVDSGTFYDDAFGAAMAARSKEYGSSIGFFHPESEPDAQGVYHHIHSYERSFLPRAKAANQLTALSVIEKENNMGAKIEEKMAEFVKLAGSAEKAAELIEAATQIAANAEKLNLRSKEAGGAPDANEAKAKKKPMDDAEAEEEDTEVEDNPEEEDDEEEAKKEAALLDEFANGIKTDVIAAVKELIAASDTARAEKEGKAITALEATVKEQADTIKALQDQVAKLTGQAPKAIKQGFRASAADSNTAAEAPKVKEAALPSTPGVPQGLNSIIDMIVGQSNGLPTQ